MVVMVAAAARKIGAAIFGNSGKADKPLKAWESVH